MTTNENVKNSTMLLALENIGYKLHNVSGNEIAILEDINLQIHKNKITGIVGKSGAGKSILLKIIAGLLEPNSGRIIKANNSSPKITIVFEDASLFPWLNVLENIELGLKTSQIPEHESYIRINEILDLIGLGGYEHSYPKELSAGMKQRVNFARALVSEPDILLMDEPFASLDTLTAKSLRSDLMELWARKMLKTQSMVLVTHNVDDVVKICSNVGVLKNRPGTITSNLELKLPSFQDQDSKAYATAVEKIYSLLSEEQSAESLDYKTLLNIVGISIRSFIEFLEILISDDYEGSADISHIADDLQLNIDDLLPMLELAKMLNFAKINDSIIRITTFGRAFAIEKNDKKKQQMFGEYLMKHINVVEELINDYPQNLKHLTKKLEKQVTHAEASDIIKSITELAKYGKVIVSRSRDFHAQRRLI